MADVRIIEKPLDIGPLIEEVLTALQASKREVQGYRDEVRAAKDEIVQLRQEVAALSKTAAKSGR